jgi:hypothetical protein
MESFFESLGLVIKWKFFESFGVGKKMESFFESFGVGRKMKIFEKSWVGKKMESFFESFGVGKKMESFFDRSAVGKKMKIFSQVRGWSKNLRNRLVAFVIDESDVIETWSGERKIQIQNAHFILMDIPHNLSDHSEPLSQTILIFFACKCFCSFFPT